MRFFKLLFSKAAMVALSILLQIGLFLLFLLGLNQYFELFQIISLVVGLIVFLSIINQNTNPDYKIPWLVTVVCLPLFGTVLYLMFAQNGMTKRKHKKFKALEKKSSDALSQAQSETEMILQNLGEYAGQSRALFKHSTCFAFQNTLVRFLASGEEFFENLKADLKAAKSFIFMEYFIIERGKMWNEILEILQEKVEEGVEVKLLYDDFGCMGKLRSGYYKKLRKKGIECYKFNRFVPIVSSTHNNRDHRKITVIDGSISYTGGINLADEYVNATHPFGHWKDTAVRLEGEATNNFSLMFLQNYSIASKQDLDFSRYVIAKKEISRGIVQPFGDGPKPLYSQHVGENLILNIVNQAKDYVYISTPYLICDYELLEGLKRAASRGVKVKLVTPGVPDKKIIWHLTRSNYKTLMDSGVEIYQYSPGFIHSKVIIADGRVGVVGTINLDYRSLVHHFECGVYMVDVSALEDIVKDFESVFSVSALQDEKSSKLGFLTSLICSILKIFSPLL